MLGFYLKGPDSSSVGGEVHQRYLYRDVALHPLFPEYRNGFSRNTTMHLSLTDLSIVGLFLSSVSAVPTTRNNDKKNRATTYSECQKLKPQGEQLNGCPEGTLYVSQTDPQANYGSVSCVVGIGRTVVDVFIRRVDPESYHESVSRRRTGLTAGD